MRGVDLAAQARGVARALGIPVTLDLGPPPSVQAFCPKLEKTFEVRYRLPSQAERALKMLHSDVYRARGEFVFKEQRELCAMCGRRIPANAYEIDHIKSRGAHGRNDAVTNLQAVCAGLSGCDLHRRKHGG